jgi:hypothetical protein
MLSTKKASGTGAPSNKTIWSAPLRALLQSPDTGVSNIRTGTAVAVTAAANSRRESPPVLRTDVRKYFQKSKSRWTRCGHFRHHSGRNPDSTPMVLWPARLPVAQPAEVRDNR